MSGSDATADPITIDVWLSDHPVPHFLDPVQELAEQFNKAHPEYLVRIRGIDYREISGTVRRAVADGDLPDIAEYHCTSSQLARDTRDADGAPLFTSIQRVIGGRTEILGEPVTLDDITPALRGYYSQQGDLASVPIMASTTVLFGNRPLLSKAGVEEMPRTWAELETACAAVTSLTGGPAHGVTWPVHGSLFLLAAAAQGAALFDNDNGHAGRATRVDLAGPEVLAFVTWWQRMHQEGHYLEPGGDWSAATEAFAGKEVAFLVHSSVAGPEVAALAEQSGFELDFGPLPHNGELPYAGDAVGGQSLWLRDGLPQDKRDGALAFILFLTNPRSAAHRQRTTGSVPVTTPAIELLRDEHWFEEYPEYKVAAEQVVASDCSPAALGPIAGDLAGIQDVLTAAMHDVLHDGAQPAARFAQATTEAQTLLDRYNAPALAARPTTPDALDVG